jgi:glutathione S-transferase
MKLFYVPASPFARKCRIVASETGLSDKIVLVNATPSENPSELIAANPIVQVPTLILDDGRSVIGSDMICSFLIALSGNKSLYSDDLGLEERRIEGFGDAASEVAVKLRYELMRPPQKQFTDNITRLQDHIKRALTFLDSVTKADEYNLGTIATLCAIDYTDLRHSDLSATLNIPNLRALQTALANKEVIKNTTPF